MSLTTQQVPLVILIIQLITVDCRAGTGDDDLLNGITGSRGVKHVVRAVDSDCDRGFVSDDRPGRSNVENEGAAGNGSGKFIFTIYYFHIRG